MNKRILIVLFPVLFFLLSCKETVTEPAGDLYPAKLYPYEVLYDSTVFKQRRDDLMQRIPDGSIVILTTNSIYLRNGDVDYDFHPASAFYYATGFEEPNAIAVIRKGAAGSSSSQLVMFVEERDPGTAQWLGPVYGPEGAVEHFGADSAYVIDIFPSIVSSYLGTGAIQSIYANLDDNAEVAATVTAAAGAGCPVYSVKTLLDGMRLVKSPLEIESIRRAVGVSVQAFVQGMRVAEPLVYEYEVEAAFDLVLRLNGCPRPSFPTIVASGPNITTIHYDVNTRQMMEGDLVMIDFGAEYGYYAGDLTRTLPVNGRFTLEQAVIYDIVKASHDAVIAGAAPGVSYFTLFNLNRDMIIDGLLEKGVISGTRSEIVASGQYRLYIPAGLGHSIGLDVHDPWPLDANNDKILRENMILAIEPHVYLNAGDLTVAAPFRGVCARIEDDILITSTGCEILSVSLPSTRGEIEALMK